MLLYKFILVIIQALILYNPLFLSQEYGKLKLIYQPYIFIIVNKDIVDLSTVS